jgi:S-adenosylmethionine hydrolase
MLYLFTDFGYEGPYIGQMKSVLVQHLPHCQVIDLMHDVPSFNIKSGAYLLSAVSRQLPQDSVIVAVVDPKVGSKQKGVVLRADYRWFVGPDNGLFDIVADHANSCHWYDIVYQPVELSCSFHGRDIYAPVASKILLEDTSDSFLSPLLKPGHLPMRQFPKSDLREIIYIDQFGSLMTGLRANMMGEKSTLNFLGQKLIRANTFSDVDIDQAFYYENSQGLIEIAVNCGSAQQYFSANIGDSVEVVT